MKKLLTFLLAILYLGVSSGMAFQVHYCMDKVSELSLIPAKFEKCPKCGMSGNKCCRDEMKFIKLQDAHKQSLTGYLFSQPVVAIFREIPVFISPGLQRITRVQPCANAPPGIAALKRHILFCRFNV
ncbi:MAG: hypothetical protein ABI151_09925 [Chitinophagaceae bacterium]